MQRTSVALLPSILYRLLPLAVIVGALTAAVGSGCEARPTAPEAPTVAGPPPSAVVTVYAPWSMELRLRRIFEKFQLARPGVTFRLHVSKPGPLIKRMKEGALPDVYISMGPVGVERLRDLGLVRERSEREILRQRLILVCSDAMKDTVKSVHDLAKPEVTVVGMPPTGLSAGVFSHQALKELGLLETVAAKERISPFSLFVKKEVDVAIMYEECVYEEDLWVGARVPRPTINVVEPLGEPFPVIAVGIKGEGPAEVAQEFIDFLTQPEAQQILNRQ